MESHTAPGPISATTGSTCYWTVLARRWSTLLWIPMRRRRDCCTDKHCRRGRPSVWAYGLRGAERQPRSEPQSQSTCLSESLLVSDVVGKCLSYESHMHSRPGQTSMAPRWTYFGKAGPRSPRHCESRRVAFSRHVLFHPPPYLTPRDTCSVVCACLLNQRLLVSTGEAGAGKECPPRREKEPYPSTNGCCYPLLLRQPRRAPWPRLRCPRLPSFAFALPWTCLRAARGGDFRRRGARARCSTDGWARSVGPRRDLAWVSRLARYWEN